MAISELQDHLGYWLRSVSNHVSQSFAQKLLATGVTVAEWVILREMYNRNNTAPSDLAELTGLTRGAVSKLADRLIAKDLLTRTFDKNDRRYQALTLTSSAKQLVPKLTRIADRNDEECFAALKNKERAKLLATLKKLVAANNLSTAPLE